jgi:hypothetical protein
MPSKEAFHALYLANACRAYVDRTAGLSQDMRGTIMALEKELETYLARPPSWVREGRVGKWVVIRGEEVLDFYDSANAALEAGYARYGLDSGFMVRQIAETDKVIQTSRRAVHVPHNQ